MTRYLHRLGFHGRNWRPYWCMGNIWVRCTVCDRRRMLSFDNASEAPLEMIAIDHAGD